MTLEKAIKTLEKEYVRGKQSPYVKNPLAWALYQVWGIADREEGEK